MYLWTLFLRLYSLIITTLQCKSQAFTLSLYADPEPIVVWYEIGCDFMGNFLLINGNVPIS